MKPLDTDTLNNRSKSAESLNEFFQDFLIESSGLKSETGHSFAVEIRVDTAVSIICSLDLSSS
jgi:hypothetical protein